MNNRERMRSSNRHAVEHLLEDGHYDIWLKPHVKNKDRIYHPDGNYWQTDLWNMWDGISWKDNELWFLAINTNKWHSEKAIRSWLQNREGVHALAINVRTNPIKVNVRKY